MIGTRYWATGITCRWTSEVGGNRGPGWGASLAFLDNGFANDRPEDEIVSTQGTLESRYFVPGSATSTPLAVALNVLIHDARNLGIEFRRIGDLPAMLYVDADGDDSGLLPPDWRDVIGREAVRLGWTSYDGVMETQGAATSAPTNPGETR